MFQWSAFLIALGVILTAGTGVWLASLLKRDVSIVDSLWPVMFLLAAITYDLTLVDTGPRAAPLLVLVAIWALRLFVYITWRNWGEGEDRRYQEIRANNGPNFELKSLFIVFVLQGLIAWIVSLPLMAAIGAQAAPNALDYLGVGLWAIGMLFEAGGDYQLSRFKSDPDNRGKVMDRGLWRYTRHPNYFGNACIWWGFGLIAMASGAWWALVSPLLMTFLLLKVSGVSLLEKDIGERRPAYADYIARTSAFIPLPPKKAATSQTAHRG
jgi:steroid 5-alpha reductase family enzyme